MILVEFNIKLTMQVEEGKLDDTCQLKMPLTEDGGPIDIVLVNEDNEEIGFVNCIDSVTYNKEALEQEEETLNIAI